ncbi:hypothetical protein M407DRAFT_32724 [Tulasnella calospora MUT 4182]|uniref:DUF7918 domain-containing protein n=1 Tax=Tulasnella calospora MUT 4182 TaxID=1051891 RepID=A0A0C3PSB6_9AGAM|nr:hypothetical protein M407DRAFT_32724 [Tulasnella calospora MUT 4182]
MHPPQHEITELTFRGFSTQIRIGDRRLPVYKPEYDEETKTASAWIASEPGEEYFVCWRKNAVTEYYAAGEVYIDGPRQRSNTLARPFNTVWRISKGERTAPEKERPFIFSKLTTTGDDDTAVDKNVPIDPGTITVKIFREIIASGPEEWDGVPCDPFSTQIHEKSKKAGGHITKMGDERKASPMSLRYTKPFTPEDSDPYVVFILRYRPEAILRAGGFMPQPEHQSQSEPNDDADEGADEVAQAEAEIAALEAARQTRVAALAKRKGVKLEDVEADLARKRRKVKQEETINVDLYFAPAEVIDLTDL